MYVHVHVYLYWLSSAAYKISQFWETFPFKGKTLANDIKKGAIMSANIKKVSMMLTPHVPIWYVNVLKDNVWDDKFQNATSCTCVN